MTEAPIYQFSVPSLDGKTIDFSSFKGKKILIVNTASKCGLTPQYEGLEELYKKYGSKLVIVGFPANNFMGQEPGSNEEISAFCKKNYGVEFPLAAKSVVVKGKSQHPVFKWLSDPSQNGWNGRDPVWNFSKYIIDEHGNLIGYFDPGVSPLSNEFISVLHSPQS